MATRLTDRDLERVFDVTRMTLYHWRQGTATRTKLPTRRRKSERAPIEYDSDKVLAWAERNGITIVVHPDQLAPLGRKRPGPKPRLVTA